MFTEPGWNVHKADEIGIDDFQAKRSPDDAYRTTPLRALWDDRQIHRGGFYHDGRFKTLAEVIDHYDHHFALALTDREKRSLVEYLKSGPTAEETQLINSPPDLRVPSRCGPNGGHEAASIAAE